MALQALSCFAFLISTIIILYCSIIINIIIKLYILIQTLLFSQLYQIESEATTLEQQEPGSYTTNQVEVLDETCNSDDGMESTTASTSIGSTISRKRKISKTADDSVPLPEPFPLLKHYRKDVEEALKNGKMNKETRSSFLHAVASAMLMYKKYPTRDDYTNVGRSIIASYPFLKSPTQFGTPHVRYQYYYLS